MGRTHGRARYALGAMVALMLTAPITAAQSWTQAQRADGEPFPLPNEEQDRLRQLSYFDDYLPQGYHDNKAAMKAINEAIGTELRKAEPDMSFVMEQWTRRGELVEANNRMAGIARDKALAAMSPEDRLKWLRMTFFPPKREPTVIAMPPG